MAENEETPAKSLSTILKEEPYLCDLHTHLMGMGNANFWIDTILMDEFVMPTNDTFHQKPSIRKALCPLVWTRTSGLGSGFVNRKKTAEFFDYLVKRNVFRSKPESLSDSTDSDQRSQLKRSTGLELTGYEEAMKPLRDKFPPALYELVTKDLYHDLIHGCLQFILDFSYDVILTLSDLSKGLGIRNSDCDGFLQLAVTGKLGGHLPTRSMKFQDFFSLFNEFDDLQDRSINFQHWIVFNARKQKFEIVYGMQVEQLRKLIYIDANKPSEAAKLARAHLINAFSMCDAEGNRPRPIDFHGFHGFFTPEFYPRRFALKDSIYSQRLDVLAALIGHIMERYRTCLPPVKYCELSVSANDLSKQWVFDVLRSVRLYDKETVDGLKKEPEPELHVADEQYSSFTRIVVNGSFPYLLPAFKSSQDRPDLLNVTYRFLAGFDRQKIRSHFPTNQEEALQFLYRTPHEAILLMWDEIKKTQNDQRAREQVWVDLEKSYRDTKEEKEERFDPCLKQLRMIRRMGIDVPYFYTWVVGLDLFGDELGYPYCPFVARPFIEYVFERRGEGRNKDNDIYFNKYFGMRVHGGENVQYADDRNPAYRSFIAHMYIVFRSLLFLQQKLKYGIRIGHGIAFNRILCANLSTPRHRKSSVLLAEMHALAKILFQKIAFEVNLTSNEYLLGQSLRGGDFKKILCLGDLFQMNAPITLSTDDDGIWPIDQCPVTHPGHQSLAAEYCRAISSSLIETNEHLRWTFETMKKFCFQDMKYELQPKFIAAATEIECPPMNNLIVHPHIISLILAAYGEKEKNAAIEEYNVYAANNGASPCELHLNNGYAAQRVAFVCICAKRDSSNKEELRKEYQALFGNPKTSVEEFDFIFGNWIKLYGDFVACETIKCPEIMIDNLEQSQRKNHIISMNSTSEDFGEFLQKIRWSGAEINIRVYANEAVAKDVENIFNEHHESVTKENPYGGTLFVYTNTDKFTYAYSKFDQKFQLRLNPRASRRETTEQNFIYVLCQHSRAATAALNLISEQLTKLVDALALDSAICKSAVVGSNIHAHGSDD